MIMEYRPYSRPERSPDIQTEPTLPERYVISRAITRWRGPKHMSYDARLRSYFNWPHSTNPAPEYLSSAGIFIRVRPKYSFRKE